jgi:hypothetical protein
VNGKGRPFSYNICRNYVLVQFVVSSWNGGLFCVWHIELCAVTKHIYGSRSEDRPERNLCAWLSVIRPTTWLYPLLQFPSVTLLTHLSLGSNHYNKSGITPFTFTSQWIHWILASNIKGYIEHCNNNNGDNMKTPVYGASSVAAGWSDKRYLITQAQQ